MPGRVLLISANRYETPFPVFPLGLACLDHALRRAGHSTAWLDRLVDAQTPAEAVAAFRPDYTGISLRNVDDVLIRKQQTFHGELRSLCAEARAAGGGTIILGGSGFSIFPREILAATGADYGIQGEGEESLVQLLAALEGGGDPAAVPGLVYRRGAEIVINPPRRSPAPPGPDWAAVPPRLIRHYLEQSSMLCAQTQRGCPFHCAYCTYPLIEGPACRRRDPEAVAEEWSALEALGARYVFLVDSVFNITPDHVGEVCEALIRKNVRLKWGCFLRPREVTRDLMRLMARAGLAHVEFGSDSFCDEVLAAFDKRLTFADILEASEAAAAAHVEFCHFLICGGPGETEATLQTTFANSRRLPGGVVMAVAGVRIYPGTTLARRVTPDTPPETLLEPRYHLAPGWDPETVLRRLEEFSRQAPNWIVGDPPAAYLHMAKRLRERGVIGPLWSYLAMMQRLAPALRRQ
jgi:radical SAM superfamily enzyme YgiQ (UPF0313 family)